MSLSPVETIQMGRRSAAFEDYTSDLTDFGIICGNSEIWSFIPLWERLPLSSNLCDRCRKNFENEIKREINIERAGILLSVCNWAFFDWRTGRELELDYRFRQRECLFAGRYFSWYYYFPIEHVPMSSEP